MLNCGCLGTRDHVPLTSNALNSSNTACLHSECFKPGKDKKVPFGWIEEI